MTKTLTCIACPQGCLLTAEIENGFLVRLTGNKCPKGEAYGRQESEHPLRTLATTVPAAGLEIAMVPVRTSQPIPKARIPEAMACIKRIRLETPVRCGQVVAADFLGLGVDVIATRAAGFRFQPPAMKPGGGLRPPPGA